MFAFCCYLQGRRIKLTDSSACGWRGRPRADGPSFASTLPAKRSCSTTPKRRSSLSRKSTRRLRTTHDRPDPGHLNQLGQFGLLRNQKVRFPAKAIEDCLIYKIPYETFQHLWENDENFADFVEIEDHSRLRSAVRYRCDPYGR